MIDNVNGFVPNSHSNGQESSDSSDSWQSDAEIQARYSPVSGLLGGPARMEASDLTAQRDGPAGIDLAVEEPAVRVEEAVDTLKLEPAELVASPAGVLRTDEPAAEEPAAEEPAAEEPAVEEPAVEEPAVEEPAVEPVEATVEAEAGPITPAPEIPDTVSAEPPLATADEPDPTQPLPVGRPPSPLELDAQIESLLFVAEGPTPIARLAEALEVKVAEVESALEALEGRYRGRGIAIQRIKDRVQLTTAPTAATLIQRFLGLSSTAPLSKAALETLAIIAYRQPITRPQIEQIRGVNSDSVIKNLLTKGLVEEAGIAEGPGRPVLYVTTPEFLQHFGLSTLTELPTLNLDEVRRNFASEILKG